MESVNKIFENHAKAIDGQVSPTAGLRYRTYAISTLRGGVGKSTLAFNLAHEIAGLRPLLVADLCAQRGLTETLMRDVPTDVTVLTALHPRILGAAFGKVPEDVSYRISENCAAFKGRQRAYLVPGDASMFAFPSTMYQQLQIANAQGKAEAVKNLLESLKLVLDAEANEKGLHTILMDTSSFYAGGTHLAWCAADAIIIPVRVDEQSIESLQLTLDLLSNPNRDFIAWNERAGSRPSPRVAAIVMTMVAASRPQRATPDRSSRAYIERALDRAEKHAGLFDVPDPADAFVITEDFVSSGRISGAKSIPISQLKIGSFHSVSGRRLQVNASVERYRRELRYLISVI